MRETDFQKQLGAGLRAQGCFCAKWPDAARAIVKPFDLCMSYSREFRPIECKLTKLNRKAPLTPNDWVVREKDFEAHQLSRLFAIEESDQGKPLVAVAIVRIEMLRVMEKRAWLIPVNLFRHQTDWRIGDLNTNGTVGELIWMPAVGWLCPWFPKVDKEKR